MITFPKAREHAHNHEHHQHGPALNPELTREVGVEVPAEEVARAFKKVIKRYQKQARIPGFRAGKVPESLIRARFADGIRQDVVESVLPNHFRTAIEQQKLQPISQPQVIDLKLEDGQPLTFKAAFEVLPEFSVEGYQQDTGRKAGYRSHRRRVQGRAGSRPRLPLHHGAGHRRPRTRRWRLGADQFHGQLRQRVKTSATQCDAYHG